MAAYCETSISFPLDMGDVYYYLSDDRASFTVRGKTDELAGAYIVASSVTIGTDGQCEDIPITGMYPSSSEPGFKGCTKLTSIELPDSWTGIQGYGFDGCTSLTKVKMGNSIDWMGTYAFQNCNNLNEITLSNSLTEIAAGAFIQCSSLMAMIIPYQVKSIQLYAFRDCKALELVVLSPVLEMIGNSAFYGCGFASITLPSTLTTVSGFAFGSCTELTSVYCCGNGDISFTTAFSGISESVTVYKAGGSASFADGSVPEMAINENMNCNVFSNEDGTSGNIGSANDNEPEDANEGKDGLGGGAIAGIVVGVIVVAAAVIIVVVVLYLKRGANKGDEQDEPEHGKEGSDNEAL